MFLAIVCDWRNSCAGIFRFCEIGCRRLFTKSKKRAFQIIGCTKSKKLTTVPFPSHIIEKTTRKNAPGRFLAGKKTTMSTGAAHPRITGCPHRLRGSNRYSVIIMTCGLSAAILAASSASRIWMQLAWQCCTQLGSLPSACLPAQRLHCLVSTGKYANSHLSSPYCHGPTSLSLMPYCSGGRSFLIWHASSQEWQPVHYL